MFRWHCRVCGLEYSAEDAEDLPWGPDEKVPSYNFCACCGVEFGYGDFTPTGARRWRSLWLERDAKWDDPKFMPTDWDLEQQLRAVPDAYR